MSEQIDFAAWEKLDLRVGRILKAENHPNADRLLVLEVDLGGKKRQLVAGLRPAYRPEELAGKLIVLLANLKPAKLRGIESQGMVLAAVGGEGKVSLLTVDREIEPGARVS